MKDSISKIAVFLYGPPGSGKGTQAKLLADNLGLYHFDSGDFLRKLINDPKKQNDPVIKKEKELNNAGKLNTPSWFLGAVKEKIGQLITLGESVVFSGAIRTMYEAFGEEGVEGLIDFVEKGYGKENIFIFLLGISQEESVKRNSTRMSCLVCGFSPMAGMGYEFKSCPSCGGEIIRRKDDDAEIIKVRLKEYEERVGPVIGELQKRGYNIIKIDGTPAPYKIHEDLDKLAEKLIRKAGGKPGFLNYKPDGARHPYKASICASVNDVVVHGFPGDYILKPGDILKLDFGVIYKGFYSDGAATFGIGKISEEARKLIETTKESLALAIKECWPGNTLGDIGSAVENFAKKRGFRPIKGLTGHGIGSKLHEDPVVFNHGTRGMGMKLAPGMVLAIEPMLSAGSDKVIQLDDESWATSDKSLSAHFEHTVAITEKGPRILTRE
ncbi:MAG: type I methionyl aminopeptidase [Candidatus Wolfebacteria bacterium]|nr:type I methionyl aminopeptidase [Candidatus Wolfebacteria bacterium]